MSAVKSRRRRTTRRAGGADTPPMSSLHPPIPGDTSRPVASALRQLLTIWPAQETMSTRRAEGLVGFTKIERSELLETHLHLAASISLTIRRVFAKSLSQPFSAQCNPPFVTADTNPEGWFAEGPHNGGEQVAESFRSAGSCLHRLQALGSGDQASHAAQPSSARGVARMKHASSAGTPLLPGSPALCCACLRSWCCPWQWYTTLLSEIHATSQSVSEHPYLPTQLQHTRVRYITSPFQIPLNIDREPIAVAVSATNPAAASYRVSDKFPAAHKKWFTE